MLNLGATPVRQQGRKIAAQANFAILERTAYITFPRTFRDCLYTQTLNLFDHLTFISLYIMATMKTRLTKRAWRSNGQWAV